MFYRDMEEVELHIVEAKVRAGALLARAALVAADLKLEAKRTALGRLQRQIAKLRGETESPDGPRPVNTEVREWRWQIVQGERVAIYSETEMQANRLKEAQHRQYIEEIERIHQAFANNLGDAEIQNMMIMTKSMPAVGKCWRETTKREQKLEAAIQQGHGVAAETARLQLEAKIYKTRHIVEEVLKVTGITFHTDDVTDQLDILASEGRIAERESNISHWRLNLGDFKIATVHMCLVARTKVKRKTRIAKRGAKTANKPA